LVVDTKDNKKSPPWKRKAVIHNNSKTKGKAIQDMEPTQARVISKGYLTGQP
jgi:hypothetical protein